MGRKAARNGLYALGAEIDTRPALRPEKGLFDSPGGLYGVSVGAAVSQCCGQLRFFCASFGEVFCRKPYTNGGLCVIIITNSLFYERERFV